MDTKKKKKVDIDEEEEARINNAYADFMEKAMNGGGAKPGNAYREQSKRLIQKQKKKQ